MLDVDLVQFGGAEFARGGDGGQGDLQVAIGQVQHHDARRLQQLEIALDRLARQQMGRHRVG
ncbi:hypothetical protein V8F63_12280 [Brevundimonas sp. LF-1]|uniref:hypothetical protein n=1 Tax=Brevundimonas sp. LF-1 TaxID=3126100 RepID=UPI0030DFDF51